MKIFEAPLECKLGAWHCDRGFALAKFTLRVRRAGMMQTVRPSSQALDACRLDLPACQCP
jgi:hypothetical protein